MPHEIVQVSVRNPLVKILLILLLIVAGVWSYFVIRWYVGNTLAEYFNPDGSDVNVARMAVSMAPNDPLTHWRIAQLLEKNLVQQAEAVAEYEKAVNLSPNDYRFWMTLGTAYERAGEADKAEQALKRAVALAPSYAYPHWFLGNLLLRNARYDEAFAELRRASEADSELRPQQFNLIWQVYGDDPEALKTAVGPTSTARAAFALYLVSQKQFEEGLRVWGGLSNEEKQTNKDTAAAIIASLNKDFKFHDTLKVWSEIASEKYRAEIGRVFDGGFEEVVEYDPDAVFGWQVKNAPEVQITIDPDKSHSGARSLKLMFEARANLEGVNVYQLVPVQPGTAYDLECYVSTNKLETGRAPHIDVLDPTDNSVIVASPPAPSGTSPWSRISLSFKTSEKTEAVVLRVVRTSCSTKETPVCPIFGSIWYDDFSIKRRN